MDKKLKVYLNLSTCEVINNFINKTLDNNGIVFGGSIRDMVANVQPTDIDVFLYCSDIRYLDNIVLKYINSMNDYIFQPINEDIDINWTLYKNLTKFKDEIQGSVFHYIVQYEDIFFKVDLIASKYVPCFGNLDCIVNGLCLKKNNTENIMSYVSHDIINSKYSDNEIVNIAKQMIIERKAGILPNCPEYRIEKMKIKEYNVDKFII